MSEIVILVSSLVSLRDRGVPFLFSDRHASVVQANFWGDLADLIRLDWKIWQTRDFKRDPNDPDKLTRYQAEALAHRHVPVAALQGVVCHGAEEETSLKEMVHNSQQDLAVYSRPGWYL